MALTRLGVGLGRSEYRFGLNISASKSCGAPLILFMPSKILSPICCRLGSCSVSVYVIIPLRPGVL